MISPSRFNVACIRELKKFPNDVLLTSPIIFVLFMVKFDYEKTSTGINLIGLAMKCVN